MKLKTFDIQKAKGKARHDAKHFTESFLKGTTNHFSKTVDVYMYESYASERLDILAELREQG
jgi:carboxypeptidase C (cathepsin A)